jgi:hypothetical protein
MQFINKTTSRIQLVWRSQAICKILTRPWTLLLYPSITIVSEYLIRFLQKIIQYVGQVNNKSFYIRVSEFVQFYE